MVEILTLFVLWNIIISSIKVANEGQFNWLNPHFESPTETWGFFAFRRGGTVWNTCRSHKRQKNGGSRPDASRYSVSRNAFPVYPGWGMSGPSRRMLRSQRMGESAADVISKKWRKPHEDHWRSEKQNRLPLGNILDWRPDQPSVRH